MGSAMRCGVIPVAGGARAGAGDTCPVRDVGFAVLAGVAEDPRGGCLCVVVVGRAWGDRGGGGRALFVLA